jgi:hypothetical protein
VALKRDEEEVGNQRRNAVEIAGKDAHGGHGHCQQVGLVPAHGIYYYYYYYYYCYYYYYFVSNTGFE